jgi:hypothetical protein
MSSRVELEHQIIGGILNRVEAELHNDQTILDRLNIDPSLIRDSQLKKLLTHMLVLHRGKQPISRLDPDLCSKFSTTFLENLADNGAATEHQIQTYINRIKESDDKTREIEFLTNQVVKLRNNGNSIEEIRRTITERFNLSVTSSTAPLKIIYPDELLAMDVTKPPPILAPWLLKQNLCMIHGYRGVGKSFFSIGLGMAVARGDCIFKPEWNAPAPMKTILVDGELPLWMLQERIGIAGKMGEGEPGRNFGLLTPDMQDGAMPNIGTVEGQQELEPIIQDFDLIILDNISTLASGLDENSALEWSIVQNWLLHLRKIGKTVIFFHHSGKFGTQRGTSRREDALDIVIKMKEPEDFVRGADGVRFEVHFEKARSVYGKSLAPFEAQIERNTWTIRYLDENTKELIIDMYEGGMSTTQISKEMQKSVSYVSRVTKHIRRKK